MTLSAAAKAPGQESSLAAHAPKDADADLFPLAPDDHKVKAFEARIGHQALENVFACELYLGDRERLSDGEEYVVLDTRVRPHSGSVARLLAREWLRREAARVLCARRQEGPTTSDLVPPQPLLELPLAIGKQWRWRGTSGGLPCESTSTVAAREAVNTGLGMIDKAWRIDTTTSSAHGDRLERSLWLAPGLGPVQERSTLTTGGRSLLLNARLQSILDAGSLPGVSKARRRS